MGTTAEKLQALINTKNAIKQSIISKGVTVNDTDTFASYASKISSITPKDEQTKIISANGEYDPEAGKVFSHISVYVPNPYKASTDEEMASYLDTTYMNAVVKYIGLTGTYEHNVHYKVNYDGYNVEFIELAEMYSSGAIISENGTHDTTHYKYVDIQVDRGYVELNTAAEMDAILTDVTNQKRSFKFTGTTDANYVNGDIYIAIQTGLDSLEFTHYTCVND